MTTETGSDRYLAAVEHALSTAPFYRRWNDPGTPVPLAARLAALPVLTKRDLRSFGPDGFVDERLHFGEAFRAGEIEMVSTSGTADDRLSIAWHQPWWDRSERAAARLNRALDRAFSRPHREAVLTSPVCAGNLCHVGDAPMAERTIGDLLFLNQALDPTSWGDRSIRRMAEEMRAFQPAVLEADPAYLAILSAGCLAQGYELWQPECIVLTYEFPSQIHYRQIRRMFPSVPVVSSYGSTETGHVLTQCERGLFHQNSVTCYVEVDRLRPRVGGPAVGRLLVSTLDNPWLQLLRYDVGDLVRTDGAACACGRSGGLTVKSIEGRTRDITFDTGGRVVTLKTLDDCLAGSDSLTGYQLVQTGPRDYTVRYSAEPGTDGRVAGVLPEILRAVYGSDASIMVRRDSALAPEQSGKFRLACAAFRHSIEDLFD